MASSAQGGNDRLISASNTSDRMWGDFQTSDGTVTGGRDTFILTRDCGEDEIFDFRQGEDKIALRGLAHGTAFSDLDIEEVGGDSVIHFEGNNSVTVHDVTDLTARDFTLFTFFPFGDFVV